MEEKTNKPNTDLSPEINYISQIKNTLGTVTIRASESVAFGAAIQALDELANSLSVKNNVINATKNSVANVEPDVEVIDPE